MVQKADMMQYGGGQAKAVKHRALSHHCNDVDSSSSLRCE